MGEAVVVQGAGAGQGLAALLARVPDINIQLCDRYLAN